MIIISDFEDLVLRADSHQDVAAHEQRHMPRPGHAKIVHVDCLGHHIVVSVKIGHTAHLDWRRVAVRVDEVTQTGPAARQIHHCRLFVQAASVRRR